MKRMIRPSSLQISEHCQLSAVLSQRFPVTSAAMERGSFVDAEVTRLLRGEGAPTTADPDAADCFRWLFAHVEVLEVQTACDLIDPDTDAVLSRGTPDIVGLDNLDGSLVVVDLKKREQMLAGRLALPDDNLQLHAYALAHALHRKAPSYRVCLLLFGDGQAEALWSRSYTSVEWLPLLDRIRNISRTHESRGKTEPIGKAGPHCSDCYPRIHCPHWALPAFQGPTALEPFIAPGGLTRETAGKGLLAVKALREMADRAEELLQSYRQVEGPGSVTVGDKSWEPIAMPGRRSADVAALERAGLGGYIKMGKGYQQWRLVRLPK